MKFRINFWWIQIVLSLKLLLSAALAILSSSWYSSITWSIRSIVVSSYFFSDSASVVLLLEFSDFFDSSSLYESNNCLFLASTLATSFLPSIRSSCSTLTALPPDAGPLQMQLLIRTIHWGHIFTTYSYSQNPKVDTRFQFITPPQADKIFLIIPSGTFSLRLPEKKTMWNH